MAAITLFNMAYFEARSPDGPVYVGAKLTVFAAGTSTPQPVYTDEGLSVAWLQPIETNAAGQSDGPVFLTPTPALKLVCVDSGDMAIAGYPMDDYSPAAVAS